MSSKATPKPQTPRLSAQPSQPSDPVADCSVDVEVRLMKYDPTMYSPRRLDMNLRGNESIGMQMLYRGLKETGTRMANGNYINTPADAVRWMLDQIAKNGAIALEGPGDAA